VADDGEQQGIIARDADDIIGARAAAVMGGRQDLDERLPFSGRRDISLDASGAGAAQTLPGRTRSGG
jgi:hypothetical protein